MNFRRFYKAKNSKKYLILFSVLLRPKINLQKASTYITLICTILIHKTYLSGIWLKRGIMSRNGGFLALTWNFYKEDKNIYNAF